METFKKTKKKVRLQNIQIKFFVTVNKAFSRLPHSHLTLHYFSLIPPSHSISSSLFSPQTDCFTLTSVLSDSAGHPSLKFRRAAVSLSGPRGDGSSRVVSGGQRRFNWFSFSLRLLLGPQRLSMGTANWPSPVATWRSRQTWPGRHFCRSTGTAADERFMPTTRLCGSVSLGTTVWCLPPPPSGHQIYRQTDWDQRDATWYWEKEREREHLCMFTLDWALSLSFRLWGWFCQQRTLLKSEDIWKSVGCCQLFWKLKMFIIGGCF